MDRFVIQGVEGSYSIFDSLKQELLFTGIFSRWDAEDRLKNLREHYKC